MMTATIPRNCLKCGELMFSKKSKEKGFHQECQPRFPSSGRIIPEGTARRMYGGGS